MPKKNKNSKKQEIVDDIDPEKMTTAEIMDHLNRVKAGADDERNERNYLTMEKDIILKLLDVLRKRLENKDLEIRNLSYDEVKLKDKHNLEINVLKQKLKYLMFENQKKIEDSTNDNNQTMKTVQEDSKIELVDLLRELRESQKKMKTDLNAHDLSVRNLKLKYADEMTQAQTEFENRMLDTQTNYKNKMSLREAENDLKFRNELHEVEERKNLEIHNLIQTHNKLYKEMKDYYNDITLNSVNLINGLKQECENLRKKDDILESRMSEMLNTNRQLNDKLDEQLKVNKNNNVKLKRFTHIKYAAKEKDQKISLLDDKVDSLDKEISVLSELLKNTQEERDIVKSKFVESIIEVNQKSGLRSCLLQLKLESLQKQLEKTSTQIGVIVKNFNLDPVMCQSLCKSIDEVLITKNATIKDLQFELSRVCKAHNDLVKTYESRLKTFKIPAVETGFYPVKTVAVDESTFGAGPAGLVSKCVGL